MTERLQRYQIYLNISDQQIAMWHTNKAKRVMAEQILAQFDDFCKKLRAQYKGIKA